MTNERLAQTDISRDGRGWPHDAAIRRKYAHLTKKELIARIRYDKRALELARQAEREYKPFVLPERNNILPAPGDIADARAAVAEAFIDTNTTSALDNSPDQVIIDPKLPKTATVEILDNVA